MPKVDSRIEPRTIGVNIQFVENGYVIRVENVVWQKGTTNIFPTKEGVLEYLETVLK